MTATKTLLLLLAAIAFAQAECGAGLHSCGDACYDSQYYCCPNGQLLQAWQCPGTSSSTTSSSSSSTSSTTSSSSTSTPSTTSAAQAASYCGAGLTACGPACFNSAEGTYCCLNGVLSQKWQCDQAVAATTSSSSTTSKVASTSSTTSTTNAAAPSTSSTSSSSSSSQSVKTSSSTTSSSSTSSTSAAATTAAPVVAPAPVARPVPNSNCTASCAGTCYDPTLFGCSSNSQGVQQFLCPTPQGSAQSTYWLASIDHTGTSPFLGDSSYVVFRNVQAFGAKGDGVTDDTAAINAAITAYGRCGQGCDSTTTRPALVYFPPGKYIISSPIIQYYQTQLVGDAISMPTILAAPSFKGMAMIDSNPYGSTGDNWYTNQNNFYRQIRNFIFDTTLTADNHGTTCIHWQVAQATSLTNLVFKMSTTSGNTHQGIWMENGSGGWISDLIFYGGATAMWVGNQQFTSRNISIYNSNTGIYMNWNWGWTFKTLYISGVNIGVDMSSVGDKGQQLVGSIVLVDVTIVDSVVGVKTGTGSSTSAATSCSLLIDNGYFTNVNTVVVASDGTALVPGSTGTTHIPTWGQGHVYNSANQGNNFSGYLQHAERPAQLIDASQGNNYYFERPKPQYENHPVSDFVSVKAEGAYGDGVHDDTAAIQATLYKYAGCRIIYFPAGTYVLSSTVIVPVGSKIVGEVWSALMAKGNAFQDASNPVPMIQIGNSGDVGVVELSDLLFTSSGAQPGAILVQWNIQDPKGAQGSGGMWDCHFRVGGAAGTNQQISQCRKLTGFSQECVGTFMLMHLSKTASAYLENVWMWTADHDLDAFGADMSGQITIYNGRGLLVESTAGVWMYGTAVEHNVFYQYQLQGAENVFMAMIQTETPYFQASPASPYPWATSTVYNDPDYSSCEDGSESCGMAWGMRYLDSSNVYLYGAGHYNFFQNYNQTCLDTEDCQDAMIDIQTDDSSEIYLYGMNTKASIGMIHTYGETSALATDNVNTFCSTIHYLANAKQD